MRRTTKFVSLVVRTDHQSFRFYLHLCKVGRCLYLQTAVGSSVIIFAAIALLDWLPYEIY